MNWSTRYAADVDSAGSPWDSGSDYIFNHPHAQTPVQLDPFEVMEHYIPMHTALPGYEYDKSKSSYEMWGDAVKNGVLPVHQKFTDELLKNGVKKPIMAYHCTDGKLFGKHPGLVIDGHHRLLEAARLGLPTVPVSFIPAPKADIEDRVDHEY
jgi:hypothetical protein